MIRGKKLIDILAPVDSYDVRGSSDVTISGIAYDSNAVRAGTLFCCIPGSKDDGHRYFASAAASGAAAALVTEFQEDIPLVTQVKVADPRLAMALAADRFYDRPSDSLKMIGVTGTNGKTTTTYLLESILACAGFSTGLIGTIETRIGTEVLPSVRTTPESVDLQRLLRRMVDKGAGAVVMEVSSHAIELNRHAGCRFDAIAFTNLSQDHLDFHNTMDEYFLAKRALFTDLSVHKPDFVSAINTDDEWGKKLTAGLGYESTTFGFGSDCDVRAEIVDISSGKSNFKLIWSRGMIPVELPLSGRVNIYNALAAATLALDLGIPPEVIARGLSEAPGVPGRLESIECGQPFKVLVDYAHTPDGLKAVLDSCRELSRGKIITVFGCGGDRDRDKRPLMGGIVGHRSDVTIITSDNPRSEDPMSIISQIQSGMNGSKHTVIEDRRDAIRHAFSAAGDNDLVLVAGKGHESGQIAGDEIIPFDDRQVAREELKRLGWN